MAHNFKQLKIWQKSMELTDTIFFYCNALPVDERYNLVSQMNRSSCSVPSNIAEGSGKRTKLQFSEYLSISLSSAYELETQLLICERRSYGDPALLKQALEMPSEVQKMIFSFREKVVTEQYQS
jgi:four helix bundle protein